jgi:hypothetical protein
MPEADTIAVLNRLLVLHNRSLPRYLESARPWLHSGDERSAQMLDLIAADHRLTVERVGSRILEHHGLPDLGAYPMQFTDLHDLSLDYLLGELLARQRALVADLTGCVRQLDGAPRDKALAEEALGAARGHLESLEELARETSGMPC